MCISIFMKMENTLLVYLFLNRSRRVSTSLLKWGRTCMAEIAIIRVARRKRIVTFIVDLL